MKTALRIFAAAAIVATMISCDAFSALTKSRHKSAQGRPYELVVVCSQAEWDGEVGDTLRAVLTAPIPYLNQKEPLFDVTRIGERSFFGIIADHRNILRIETDASYLTTTAKVAYDVTAAPQIIITLRGASDRAIVDYLSENRNEVVQMLNIAERDRAVNYARQYPEENLVSAIKKNFGIDMPVPKGYILAEDKGDFLWARQEYPSASQGFFIYSYPYSGKESLSPEALLAARNKYAANIPGPSDGSYMTTSEVMTPDYRIFRMDGRIWCEMRGFWDVHGDFMGGPFVSYTSVDTATNRVVTLDCYIYSPKVHKRNFMRGVEHLFHLISFPEAAAQQ